MNKDTTFVDLSCYNHNNSVIYDKNQNEQHIDPEGSAKIEIVKPIEEPIITKILSENTYKAKRKVKNDENYNRSSGSEDSDNDDKSGHSEDEIDSPRRSKSDSSSINLTEEGTAIGEDLKISEKQANNYAAKKTVAQGMMDIALITANANQLRYIIEFNKNSSTYYLNLTLIVISLLLQVGVGISLIFKGRMDLKGESKHRNAKRINNYVVVGVFLVTIINVFIASFTITGNGSG